MSTGQRADDEVVPGVAGGGFDAVLASSILHSARIPAKTAARVAGAILCTPGPAARRLGRGLLRQLAVGLGHRGAHRRDPPEDCQALAGAAMREFGRVDILVNNAGIGTAVPALKETTEQFRSVIDVNRNACYWMAQACGRIMQPGSSIINISSVLGLTTAGLPQAAYAASKAGVIGLTRDLAQQWTGRRGIRVNAIAPGFFASEMTDQYDPDYVNQQILPRTLTGRLGEHGEIAAAVIFLASDASSYITGITLPVEGGLLTR